MGYEKSQVLLFFGSITNREFQTTYCLYFSTMVSAHASCSLHEAVKTTRVRCLMQHVIGYTESAIMEVSACQHKMEMSVFSIWNTRTP